MGHGHWTLDGDVRGPLQEVTGEPRDNTGSHQEFQLNGKAINDRLNFSTTGLHWRQSYVPDYVPFDAGYLRISLASGNAVKTDSYRGLRPQP